MKVIWPIWPFSVPNFNVFSKINRRKGEWNRRIIAGSQRRNCRSTAQKTRESFENWPGTITKECGILTRTLDPAIKRLLRELNLEDKVTNQTGFSVGKKVGNSQNRESGRVPDFEFGSRAYLRSILLVHRLNGPLGSISPSNVPEMFQSVPRSRRHGPSPIT